ncbi:MAG: PilT/PilU family type 4a pilus ATPase [Planctomycetes bacterium]|nr:PilT/PilU family type 4a pilus ATPase [Planctomycetota bacterium]
MAVDILKLLDLVIKEDGSDLHLAVGITPRIRVHGRMRNVKAEPLKPEDTVEMMKVIAPQRNLLEFKEKGTTDFAYAYKDQARFRVSCYRQRGMVGLAMRLLPNRILSFEQIGLPLEVQQLLDRPRGLLLVTGPTGSGKTTTLATMVDYLNEKFDCHIVTIEDPIEYYHSSKTSIVTQREIGSDVGTFGEAMRRVLRMDPDVILLGEMRDRETISTAITAAETGHLVLATLHTTGASRTVDRIIDQFPPDQQETIRVQLSVSIIAVISQVLMARCDKPGRAAAFEIMIMNSAVENHIRKNESFKITSVIQTNRTRGMVLLDDYIIGLFKAGKVSKDECLAWAQNPIELRKKMDYMALGGTEDTMPPVAEDEAGKKNGGEKVTVGGLYPRKKTE